MASNTESEKVSKATTAQYGHDVITSPITRRLDKSLRGYEKVATFQSSDRNFLLYRGFDYLHCRLLSSLQYDVNCLEKELVRLDKWEHDHDDRERRLVCKQHDDRYKRLDQFPDDFIDKFGEFKRTRAELFKELQVKLMQYDEALLKARAMSELQRPAERDYRSFFYWFESNKPLVQEEYQYIYRKEDLVTLRAGRESGKFEILCEDALSFLDVCLRKVNCHIVGNLFSTPALRSKSDDPYVNYHVQARIDVFVEAVIATVILALLVLPIVTLSHLTTEVKVVSHIEAIGVLAVCTILFSMAMALLTQARRQDIFVGSAIYWGLQVVLLGLYGM